MEKSGVGKGGLAAEMSSCATYLAYFIVWKVNLNKPKPRESIKDNNK